MSANERRFIKLSGGWLNPDAICWAEPQGDNLVVGVAQRERPIVLSGQDALVVRDCLDSLSAWMTEEGLSEQPIRG